MAPTWQEAKALLERSYAYRLLEDYIMRFDKPGKSSFVELAAREEAYAHLLDVFEQDLRLNEEGETAHFAREDPGGFLKAAIAKLLKGEGENLALTGMSMDAALVSLWRS